MTDLTRQAVSATLHRLTGCAIGEVLGMVIGTALGWPDLATVALSIVLAFVFGYGLTIVTVLRAGVAFGAAIGVAFASRHAVDRDDGGRRQPRRARRAGRRWMPA